MEAVLLYAVVGGRQSCLDRLIAGDQALAAGTDLVLEDERPPELSLLKQGLAMRYRAMREGGRQIITFLIPGDLCDMHGHLLRRSDHSVCAAGPSRVAAVSWEGMVAFCGYHPRLAAAVTWSAR